MPPAVDRGLYPEDGGKIRNVDDNLPEYTVSNPKRQQSSKTTIIMQNLEVLNLRR
jgi:hypothetical protein